MLVPLSWLKQFVPNLPPLTKLTKILPLHGLDVEAVIDDRGKYDNVVVGEITAIKPHPQADKLRLASVVTSSQGKPQDIVCGAPNIAVGQKVPVALVGAKLPNGLTIESRAIRGVTSNGMLCAEEELGLGEDNRGIMVLDPELKVGTPLAQALGLDEPVLDVDIPANRADLMSMRGIAREIAAILGRSARLTAAAMVGKAVTKKSITIKIAIPKLCPVYTARVIRGVTVKPSPAWLQHRLQSAGMRPINAVVDATNYVMLDHGQPLHAFDAAKVKPGGITVRAGRVGEKLVTLDGRTRTLDPSMLVIADPAGPIALAGVMGGLESEVSDRTTDIILESAIFDPVSIRRTSRKLGLASEASKRFEKGLWPGLPEEANRAAASLIIELCGGTERGSARAGSVKSKLRTIQFDPKYMSERLGMTVPTTKSKTVLTKLGFTISGRARWSVIVPEWRLDVQTSEDLVDEVGRIGGYDELPKDFPPAAATKDNIPPDIRFKEEIRNILADLGFGEVISHAFYGQLDGRIVRGAHFEVANPLDTTQHLLRKSLLPQVKNNLTKQADAGQDGEIFEIGYIFDPGRPGPIENQQAWKVAIGAAYKGEGKLEKVISGLRQRLNGQVDPETHIITRKAVRGRTVEFCEFDLRQLMVDSKTEFGPWDPMRHSVMDVRYREQSKYPSIRRDISFWLGLQLDERRAKELVTEQAGGLMASIETSDVFRKDGKRSLAFHIVFQAPNRTLTKGEVDDIMRRVSNALTTHGATIR